MPASRSAKKCVRQNAKRREANRAYRTRARHQVNEARVALEGSDVSAAESTVAQAARALDKTAAKGVMPRRRAARLKSRLAKKVNALRQQSGEQS